MYSMSIFNTYVYYIHVQISFYIVIWTCIVNMYTVLNKDILYMGIYIVNKTLFCGNEAGGALRGPRQGPVLEYL